MAAQFNERLFALGQQRRAIQVDHFRMTIAAGRLHLAAVQDGLVYFNGLVCLVMGTMGVFRRCGDGPLTQMTPGAAGGFRRMLLNQDI